MLAVVFSINHFHTYLYGSDNWWLPRSPPHEHHPGSRGCSRRYRDITSPSCITTERQWPDRHSPRLPNPKDKAAARLDLRVDGVEMTTVEDHCCHLVLEEVASTLRPNSQRFDHECVHGNYHPRMAWQHQGSANWCSSPLVIPWWAGCRGWHNFQRKTSPHPREPVSILAQLHQFHQGNG